MSKTSKRLKEAKEKIDKTKEYSLEESIQLIQETSKVKFDASIELHANLGIDPKKSDQIIRSSVILPHGTGKKVKIAAIVSEDKVKESKDAGADIVGSEDMIAEIKKTGKTDFDIVVTTPDMMKNLSSIARILGQRGLMPNPKTDTIGTDLSKMIGELKKGKMSFKNDKGGNLHVLVGRVSFSKEKLLENLEVFIDALKKLKPQSIKGVFIKSIILSSSMGPGIKLKI